MKSQSELLGLAMVMVLIVLGLIIYVAFSLNDSKDVIVTQQHRQLPVITNDAILFTEVGANECYGERIRDLIIRVANNENYICNNGQHVSVFTYTIVSDLLQLSLGNMSIDYNYTVYTGNSFNDPAARLFSIQNGDCSRNRESEIFFFPLRDGRRVNMKLDVCS